METAWRRLPALAAVVVLGTGGADAVAGPPLGPEAQAAFLRTAEVIGQRPVGHGVTEPWRVTLTDGNTTHDALFQSIDIRRARQRLGRGRVEHNFVDSYRYNIAAYRLAGLVGLDHMMPVTVARSWRGRRGSLTWWVDDVLMDEASRRSRDVSPPDGAAHWAQRYRMYVFAALVHDTDRNLGNVLYDTGWKLWMIDFTRAFRVWPQIDTRRLARCDRALFGALARLTEATLEAALGDLLAPDEVDGILRRRDAIAQHFGALAVERGPEAVFY